MPYKILVTRKIPGHVEGTLVEVDSVTEFWEHQILADNAVMLDEPKAAEKHAQTNSPAKGKAVHGKVPGPRGTEKLKAVEDPED